MKLTKGMLLDRFIEYNNQYFDGKLGRCEFSFLRKKDSAYGTYLRRKTSSGNEISVIRMGRCITWNEERLREILVHEMIHMYVETIEKKHFDGLFGHGWRFRRQCRRIRRNHGLRVRVHPHYKRIDKSPGPKWLDTVLIYLLDW